MAYKKRNYYKNMITNTIIRRIVYIVVGGIVYALLKKYGG